MFCSTVTVCGMQLNDKLRLGTPHDNCSAVTFYLRPNETIESLHVVTRGERRPSIFKGPYLLVRPLLESFVSTQTLLIKFSLGNHVQ
jgi:hypothetical protein